MSIAQINRVWSQSQASGSRKLMLLALANFANDDGRCYPAVPTLAEMCGMTDRYAQMVLAELQRGREITVDRNAGPRGANVYWITLDGAVGATSRPLKPASPLKQPSPLKPASPTPEAGFAEPLKRASSEPSLNRQEPSSSSPDGASLADPMPVPDPKPEKKLPDCPYEAIVAAYHAALPELKRVKTLPDKRKKLMRDFWRRVLTGTRIDGTRFATTADEALAWICRYFERAARDDWLTGRTPRSAGHENWQGDIDFVMKEDRMTKVIEMVVEASAA